MANQIDYYDDFAARFEASILACPEPEVWTTDYDVRGKVYRDMKQRIGLQEGLVRKWFDRERPVLDIGCGFGRQAVLLARTGLTVVGVDTSPGFVDLARRLCEKHGASATFLCADILAGEVTGRYEQVILFDVLEHVPRRSRAKLLERVAGLTPSGAVVLVSLPVVARRLAAVLDNRLRRRVTQHFSFFRNREEHPYPIPGKRDLVRLLGERFRLEDSFEANRTGFYVLRRV